ncbi:MAG: NAD(P)H-dependent oxidoreductase [Oscillospiraceae bacterium]
MSTIILNGSPKGNAQNSASYFLAQAFVSKMKNPCEIISIAKTNFNEILERIADYDNIIFFMPNYIHAMPGIVMKFFELFPSAQNDNKALGFIVQAGYPEGIEEEIVSRFLEQFTKRLGYKYLGTAAKGEAAGIAIFPDKFKKLAIKFSEFGLLYEQTGSFNKNYMEDFAKPYELSNFYRGLFNFADKIGLAKLGWNIMLKKHNAYQKRYDKPYE